MFDVAIIGGGINGSGAAADAALRGLSVVLCEEDDLASKTSSSSSKLIHGGLRYLENWDFYLVQKALNERQTLLELAPHLIQPMPFVLPHQHTMRPFWLLRAGLFIYDHLSRANQLPHTQLINRTEEAAYFKPLNPSINKGFLYYDCQVDDARLTIVNAIQASLHGAVIKTHTKLIRAEVNKNQWQLTLKSKTAALEIIYAKSVINAAGPWVEGVNQLLNIPLEYPMRLIKGSHLVVPKLYQGEHAYLLQHQDKRIVFAIPYHDNTLIGTTDVDFSGDPTDIQIEASEIDYLCSLINGYFNQSLNKKDILMTWSGVRPLLSTKGKNPSTLSRDYTYHYTNHPAPAVTIYGGKITTYRQLALEAIDQLRGIFPNLPNSKTDKTPLPGARTPTMNLTEYQQHAYKKYDWLDISTKERYFRNYGTQMEDILKGCTTMADLGTCFSPTLYQAEVDYLLNHEWADSCDDLLWRRTKLGLSIKTKDKTRLTAYLLKRKNG